MLPRLDEVRRFFWCGGHGKAPSTGQGPLRDGVAANPVAWMPEQPGQTATPRSRTHCLPTRTQSRKIRCVCEVWAGNPELDSICRPAVKLPARPAGDPHASAAPRPTLRATAIPLPGRMQACRWRAPQGAKKSTAGLWITLPRRGRIAGPPDAVTKQRPPRAPTANPYRD